MEKPRPEQVLRALTPENCRLLALIHRHKPESVASLSRLADRPQPNVSRSLGMLEEVGIICLVGSRPKRPELAVTELRISLDELHV
ncbi:helix-turn-helix domain-containing protein (plasmid) [Sinorhizobium chiapasense]|uniref:HVO_A0114 family putative DNA-binding protein n=1 Tax=Sinorhizobium/Ensifer group TaxID=227292 RepID=UPI002FE28CA5